MRPPLMQFLWQRYRELISPAATLATEPLLDSATLDQLRLRAQSATRPPIAFQHTSAHQLLGEQLSYYRGRGLEFEENRKYQTGDEPRLINWRLYARTGELYSKVFNEERRPEVYLVADRRASMRFGTRGQLKAAQAAKIIATVLFQAQRQALAVGGIIINESVDWFAPVAANAASLDFLHSLALPCPPIPFDTPEPDLNAVFSMLLDRVPQGSHILCVSDFTDLDTDKSASLLHQLNQRHHVDAVLIRDPGEVELGAHGTLLLDDPGTDEPIRIDGRNPELRARYQQEVAQQQSRIASIFQMAGIPLEICSTEDETDNCVPGSHGRQ